MSFAPTFSIFTFSFKPVNPTTTQISILEQDGYGITIKEKDQQAQPFFVHHTPNNWLVENHMTKKDITVVDSDSHSLFTHVQKRVEGYKNRFLLAELALLVSAIFIGGKCLNKLPGKLTYYAVSMGVSLFSCFYFIRKCKDASFDLANILISVQDVAAKVSSTDEGTLETREKVSLLLNRSDYALYYRANRLNK